MSVITIFSGSFCNENDVIGEVLASSGYRLIKDDDIVAEACRISGMAESKVKRAFFAETSVFNRFTHEKELAVAYLRLTVARMLAEDKLLFSGFCGLLIPRNINHVLHVCLIADMKSRTARAVKEKGVTEKEALAAISKRDTDCSQWTLALQDKQDPWEASLYDIVIPTDKVAPGEAGELVASNMGKAVIRPTEYSKRAISDFDLAAKVETALAREGHVADVSARGDAVTITINTNVLMLGRLEKELKSIATRVEGVTSIETRVGKGFYQPDIYRKYDFDTPSKVLLVDDEREFVKTLSERLQMRDMGSAVAYDGESALELVNEDEPEVMILDLKMPGINGLEVLREVKTTRPEIEVIILTGHGSDDDRRVCMDLGAFAYLHKPVDIDVLSETLRRANAKVRSIKDGKASRD
jgi:CheY-like chemotaxis protein